MRLVKPSIEFLNMTPGPLKTIERAGRTCYKSEDKITLESADHFVRNLLHMGHLAMIEHASASYRVICDRGITHEIVRHRLFSYAQESTRYCNYKGGVTYIIPPWLNLEEGGYVIIDMSICYKDEVEIQPMLDVKNWLSLLFEAGCVYNNLITHAAWTPQQARSVLPNALKTEIVITGNLREWLHFFELRCAPTAHPQMQEVANMILQDIRNRISVIFDKL